MTRRALTGIDRHMLDLGLFEEVVVAFEAEAFHRLIEQLRLGRGMRRMTFLAALQHRLMGELKVRDRIVMALEAKRFARLDQHLRQRTTVGFMTRGALAVVHRLVLRLHSGEKILMTCEAN